MNVYRSLICLLAISCTACVKTANIPPAELTLSSFGPAPDYPYTLDFTSSVDLQHAFNDYENSNQLPPMLICSLDPDAEFSIERPINIRAEGRVEASNKTKPNYSFTSKLVFYYYNPDGSQRQHNDFEAIRPLLAKQESVPCKVRITAYGYKAYFTNTLFIPSAIIIEQISK
ncbi:hypothetical protein [Pseudomonas capsici]|uniref:hypothetical protein n=1 Tax=Pseudomonas capsici TaxID=2810614 RepID=UPI0021F0C69B|nr:hypothetical protein [Pseudomonas capsici]MCV4264491.1 hypothetical protein [Pseudomonas capsici]